MNDSFERIKYTLNDKSYFTNVVLNIASFDKESKLIE